MSIKVFILFVLSFIALSKCEDLILGEVNNRQVIHHTGAQYPPISNLRRLKYIVYTSLDLKPIVGIEAIDKMKSKAHVNVLAGGIGFTFVTIKLKSEKSKGLDYDIKIYG